MPRCDALLTDASGVSDMTARAAAKERELEELTLVAQDEARQTRDELALLVYVAVPVFRDAQIACARLCACIITHRYASVCMCIYVCIYTQTSIMRTDTHTHTFPHMPTHTHTCSGKCESLETQIEQAGRAQVEFLKEFLKVSLQLNVLCKWTTGRWK